MLNASLSSSQVEDCDAKCTNSQRTRLRPTQVTWCPPRARTTTQTKVTILMSHATFRAKAIMAVATSLSPSQLGVKAKASQLLHTTRTNSTSNRPTISLHCSNLLRAWAVCLSHSMETVGVFWSARPISRLCAVLPTMVTMHSNNKRNSNSTAGIIWELLRPWPFSNGMVVRQLHPEDISNMVVWASSAHTRHSQLGRQSHSSWLTVTHSSRWCRCGLTKTSRIHKAIWSSCANLKSRPFVNLKNPRESNTSSQALSIKLSALALQGSQLA